MAIENQILLNGQIRSIRKITDEMKNVIQVAIGLLVMRRPQVMTGNKDGHHKMDVVTVIVRDKILIKYLVDKKVAKGDMLEVAGVFCTLRSIKKFICPTCGAENSFEGSTSFVHPLCIRLVEIKPKNVENVLLNEEERRLPKDKLYHVLCEKKSFPGNIIKIRELPKQENMYCVNLTVRESSTDEEVIKWLQWMNEISNRIYIMGNLCADPVYNPKSNGGRVCTYQLGINRKVYIREDDPNVRADYPFVKSLGDQADKDRDALRKGSLIFIDGSIQARDDFTMKKVCTTCNTECEVKGAAMEIVPYSVEYLHNCITSPDSEDPLFEEEMEDDSDLSDYTDYWGNDIPEDSSAEPSEDTEEGDSE